MRPQPMRLRARQRGDVTDVQLLMPHPMETGLRRSDAGDRDAAVPPAHHITDVTVMLGERTVFAASLSIAVSRDPVLAFRFGGALPGQRLRVTWTDNRGDSRSDDTVIA